MNQNETRDYLEHYGILGQRWGVRRFQNEDGTLTPEGRARYFGKDGHMSEDQIKNFEKDFDTLVNAKVAAYMKDKSSGTQRSTGKYYDEASEFAKQEYFKFLDGKPSIFFNQPRDSKITYITQEMQQYVNEVTGKYRLIGICRDLGLSEQQAKNAVSSYLGNNDPELNGATVMANFKKKDSVGHELNLDSIPASDYLEHWGILGMKWGVRRYQNKDGSLTEEGKQRYGVDDKGEPKNKDLYDKDLRNTYEMDAKAAQSIRDAMSGVANNLETGNGRRVTGKYPDMSDAELQARVRRLQLERAYSDMVGDTKYYQSRSEKGREFLQTAGAALGILMTILTIKGMIAKDNGGKKGK